MSATVDIHTRAPESAVITDVTSDFAHFDEAFDTAFRHLDEYLESRRISPTGPAFAIYHAVSPHAPWRATIGYPVTDAGPGSDEIHPGTLPGGHVAVIVHEGPYEGLADTWATLGEWMRTNQVESAGDPWESFVVEDSTETEPSQWRTEIVWPVTVEPTAAGRHD